MNEKPTPLPGEKELGLDQEFLDSAKLNREAITRKSWAEFQQTGLLLFINQILHLFGWAIVLEYINDEDKIANVYPARVTFRGFGEENVSRAYRKISKYLKDNIDELEKEANS